MKKMGQHTWELKQEQSEESCPVRLVMADKMLFSVAKEERELQEAEWRKRDQSTTACWERNWEWPEK